MISQGEFVRRFKPIAEFLEDQDRLVDLAKVISLESCCCDFGSKFLDSYIKLLAAYVGDDGGWINWYVWDGDMGKRRHTAIIDGKEYVVSDPKKLYKIIMMSRSVPNENE